MSGTLRRNTVSTTVTSLNRRFGRLLALARIRKSVSLAGSSLPDFCINTRIPFYCGGVDINILCSTEADCCGAERRVAISCGLGPTG